MGSPVKSRRKLTRACFQCVKGHYKCSLELPQCSRCSKRQLLCQYHNEPSFAHCFVAGEAHLEVQSSPKAILYADILPRSSSIFRHEDSFCHVQADQRTFKYLVNLLRQYPRTFLSIGRNSFIHPSSVASSYFEQLGGILQPLLRDEPCAEEANEALDIAHIGNLDRGIESLVSTPPNLDYQSILPFLQSLILVQILTLFIIPQKLLPMEMLQQAANRQIMLHHWARKLWDTVPQTLPAHFTSHQSYAIAESVRRTLLVCNEVLCLWDIWRRGYYSPSLFIRALPIDRRFYLWDLDEQEFTNRLEEDMCAPYEQHLEENIVSVREFLEMYDSRKIHYAKGTFDTMLIVGTRGLDNVENSLSFNLPG